MRALCSHMQHPQYSHLKYFPTDCGSGSEISAHVNITLGVRNKTSHLKIVFKKTSLPSVLYGYWQAELSKGNTSCLEDYNLTHQLLHCIISILQRLSLAPSITGS